MRDGAEDHHVAGIVVRGPHRLPRRRSDDTAACHPRPSSSSSTGRNSGSQKSSGQGKGIIRGNGGGGNVERQGVGVDAAVRYQGAQGRWCEPCFRSGSDPVNVVKDRVVVKDRERSTALGLVKSLTILDRLLAPLVLVAMILGVVIGVYAPGVQSAFNGAKFAGTSVPLVVGMIVMMWPALTKVQYERLPDLLKTRRLWEQIVVSFFLNWFIGPFVMLACAWAALPDLATYRTGIILVGLARCIAMVMIWNTLAGGDDDLCAILVIINSALQIVLYSPMAVFFIRVISHERDIGLEYGKTAIAVLVFLGIPLGLGLLTRLILLPTLGRARFSTTFLPIFSPLSLLGLLYTIIVIFAQQARHILAHLGPVFRTFVPLVMYFIIMFGGTFTAMWLWSRAPRNAGWLPNGARRVGYKEASVQSFTAASNNFELSIAVAVAVFGPDSDQALAATIGPLVEVPVLLALTCAAIWLGRRLRWGPDEDDDGAADLELEPDFAKGDGSGHGGVAGSSLAGKADGGMRTGDGVDGSGELCIPGVLGAAGVPGGPGVPGSPGGPGGP